MAKLKLDSTIIVFPFPLDYELSNSGSFYHAPSLPFDKPTYLYSSIRVGKVLPVGIDYEVFAELSIPGERYDLNTQGGRLAPSDLIEDLVDEALRITDNLPVSSKQTGRTQSRNWRPAGRIQLFDDQLQRLVGVQGAKVQARRWFTTYEGITDQNGNFSCNGTFNRDANYSIPWKRYDYDIRSGSLGQALFNGPKMEGNWNLEISSGASRMYAIVYQACHDYYYGNRLDLKSPPQNSFWRSSLKLAVWDGRNQDANGSHCKDCRFLGISSTIRIWNNGGTCRNIYATTIHELAHASHWELRQSNWNDNNTQSKVKGSWARGVQWALGSLRYPGYRGGAIIRPDYTQLVVDLIDARAPFNPFGFVEDINEGSENITQDDITGYTIKQIEDILGATSTWEEWENNIRNTYENPTEDLLRALFTHWN